MTILGLYTGARLNELAALETKDVTSESLYIGEGKTEAAGR